MVLQIMLLRLKRFSEEITSLTSDSITMVLLAKDCLLTLPYLWSGVVTLGTIGYISKAIFNQCVLSRLVVITEHESKIYNSPVIHVTQS